jgi:dCMP deaminase
MTISIREACCLCCVPKHRFSCDVCHCQFNGDEVPSGPDEFLFPGMPPPCPLCSPTDQRPSWDDYLMGLAKAASARSHDLQTKHGCCLVGPNHNVLSMGCNGLARGLKDDMAMPRTRPDKYPFMLHAEENAVANATGSLALATAYVTGRSCLHCMQVLWQHGVRKIVQSAVRGWEKDEEEEGLKRLFLEQSGMEVVEMVPKLSWLKWLVP